MPANTIFVPGMYFFRVDQVFKHVLVGPEDARVLVRLRIAKTVVGTSCTPYHTPQR